MQVFGISLQKKSIIFVFFENFFPEIRSAGFLSRLMRTGGHKKT